MSPARLTPAALLVLAGTIAASASDPLATSAAPLPDVPESVLASVERSIFLALPARHQQMIQSATARRDHLPVGVAACFAPGTPDETMVAFNSAIFGITPRFQNATRWSSTALTPNTGTQGDPIVLTYSFVPDGTFILNGVGEGDGFSDLFAYLNGIYGSPAAWQSIYDAVFERWSQVSGITFIRELNDDGADLVVSDGVAGVRGDLRLAGKFIDGNFGILAYNYYPDSGDMVIDTGDTFYFNTANDSLALRNVLSHEHGHGMGQAHVCPIEQTKLMEPFVSTAYDGPRHDDIRHAQFLYGDPNEPNDTTGTATLLGGLTVGTSLVLGVPPAPAVTSGSTLGLDAAADTDHFSFTLDGSRRLALTLQPQGFSYDDSAQACNENSGGCCFGNPINTLSLANLNFELRRDGVLVASGASQPAGVAESVALQLAAGGTFTLRVNTSTATLDQTQLYTVAMNITDGRLVISLPAGAPTTLAPNTPTSFTVRIAPGTRTLSGLPQLLLRTTSGGPITSIPLVPVLGTLNYQATIPGLPCSAQPTFTIAAQPTGGGAPVPFPELPGSSLSARVGVETVLFNDNFETNQGWTVANVGGLTDGAWNRDFPLADGSRGDPLVDADGSGRCYLTDSAPGNSDVDNGRTILTSPAIDLTGTTDPMLDYSRWIVSSAGGGDGLTVEVSADGSTWVLVESVNSAPGWVPRTVRIADHVPLTAGFRVRFTAADVSTPTIVEAGIDAVRVDDFACDDGAPVCGSIDFDGDGDEGTDADIEAFFAAIGGGICPTGTCGSVDFDGDGDEGTDADIEAFFRVIGGGTCAP